jgi:hypothetical protein
MNPSAVPLNSALAALERWAPVVWLKTSNYAYPALESLHIVGIALVFGTLWIVDLAILGRLKGLDVRLLARHVLPWTLAGFLLAALTGLTMFLAAVGDLIANSAFVLKMALLFVAATNAGMLHARGPIDSGNRLTRFQAGLSVLIWLAVIACGRSIAYV